MLRILAVISCAASALMPVNSRGDERPDVPPIRIAPRLFNHKDEAKLGLPTVKAEHQVLYRATEDSYKFCHEQNIAVYNDKLYVMWSNGITHESHNGQRILYSHSKDGAQWSKPAMLAEDHDGPGPLACISAGFSNDGVLFDRAFVIRSEQTSMRFKGTNKLDGWQYPTAVVWKDHLYVAYSINKEDEGVTRIALRDLQADR